MSDTVTVISPSPTNYLSVVQQPSSTVTAVGSGQCVTSSVAPTSPTFTYNPDGTLNTITYTDGTVKTFAYSAGKPAYLDTVKGGVTTRKTFSYNPDGTVASVIEAVI